MNYSSSLIMRFTKERECLFIRLRERIDALVWCLPTLWRSTIGHSTKLLSFCMQGSPIWRSDLISLVKWLLWKQKWQKRILNKPAIGLKFQMPKMQKMMSYYLLIPSSIQKRCHWWIIMVNQAKVSGLFIQQVVFYWVRIKF